MDSFSSLQFLAVVYSCLYILVHLVKVVSVNRDKSRVAKKAVARC